MDSTEQGKSWDYEFIKKIPDKYGLTISEKLEFISTFTRLMEESGIEVVYKYKTDAT